MENTNLNEKSEEDPNDSSSDEETLFQCPKCPKIFDNLKNYIIHAQWPNVHQDKRCKICQTDKEYPNLSSLKRHMKRRHSAPVKCEVCQKMLKDLENFKDHMLTHTGEKTITCTLCEKSFFTRRLLVSHHRTEHLGVKSFNRRVKCPLCEGVFALSSMKNHMTGVCQFSESEAKLELEKIIKMNAIKRKLFPTNIIHSVLPDEDLECKDCGTKFTSYPAKGRHKFNAKKNICEICDKGCCTQKLLKFHKDSEHKSLEFKCQDCKLGFSTKRRYDTHLKKVHWNPELKPV